MKRFDPDGVQLVVVGLAALASTAQPSLAPIFCIVLAGWFIGVRLIWHRMLPATPANVALALLASVILVNPWVSVQTAVSLPLAMQILVGIFLLLSVRAWAITARRLHLLLLLLGFAGLSLVIIAPFTVDWITDKYGYFSSAIYERFTPLSRKVIHPNIMAGAAAVLMVTLIAYLRITWRELLRWERILLIVAAAGLAILLIVSQSRGALTASAVGLLSSLLFTLPIRRFGWMLILGIAAAFVLLQFSGALGLLADSGGSIRGAAGRQEIWAHAREVIADFPFTGIGLGNFAAVTDLFYPFLVAGTGLSHAHNLYLQVAVDTGWPGLVAWLACLILVLLCCIQAISPRAQFEVFAGRNRTIYTACGIALLCGQLTMLIHGLTDAPLWATRPAILVWMLWGMALALQVPTAVRSS